MSRPLPELIDPLRLCGKGRSLQGSLLLTRMSRLQDVSCEPEGLENDSKVTIDFTFGTDQSGQANITGVIEVVLWIVCQRCLSPMRWSRSIKLSLALVRSELEVDKLSAQYEPLFLREHDDENMHSLAEIAESEIILALPQEAMHNEDECSIDKQYSNSEHPSTQSGEQVATDEAESKPNPFAVLQQLKDKDKP